MLAIGVIFINEPIVYSVTLVIKICCWSHDVNVLVKDFLPCKRQVTQRFRIQSIVVFVCDVP